MKHAHAAFASASSPTSSNGAQNSATNPAISVNGLEILANGANSANKSLGQHQLPHSALPPQQIAQMAKDMNNGAPNGLITPNVSVSTSSASSSAGSSAGPLNLAQLGQFSQISEAFQVNFYTFFLDRYYLF